MAVGTMAVGAMAVGVRVRVIVGGSDGGGGRCRGLDKRSRMIVRGGSRSLVHY